MGTSKINYDRYYESIDHIANGLFAAQGHSTLPTLDNSDLNISAPGVYMVTNATSYPDGSSATGKLFVIQTKANDYQNVFQVYFPNYGNIFARRKSWNSSQSSFTWGSWHSLW